MFRYNLLRRVACCWIDTDLLCLNNPDFSRTPIVLGRQPDFGGPGLINNAVLKLPADHPLLLDLLRHAEDALDRDLSWGAIGPFLLTELAAKHGMEGYARDSAQFYPIEPDHFWKLLLPEYCDSVAAASEGATFVHLWGELFNRSGYDKSACPAEGSFLQRRFQSIGTLDRFRRVYGASELRVMMAEWMAKDQSSAPAG